MGFDDRRLSMRAECWLCLYTLVLRKTFILCEETASGIRRQTLVDVGAGRVLLMPACCIPSASYANPISLAIKRPIRLWVVLKTTPTKFRLAFLKKIWKQACRRHERRDVAFAESADFAAFDLLNRTSLDGHSNTYRKSFHLAPFQIPMMSDEGKFQKKVPKIEKNRAITSHRDQHIKVDKFRCHSRGACAAKVSQRGVLRLRRHSGVELNVQARLKLQVREVWCVRAPLIGWWSLDSHVLAGFTSCDCLSAVFYFQWQHMGTQGLTLLWVSRLNDHQTDCISIVCFLVVTIRLSSDPSIRGQNVEHQVFHWDQRKVSAEVVPDGHSLVKSEISTITVEVRNLFSLRLSSVYIYGSVKKVWFFMSFLIKN